MSLASSKDATGEGQCGVRWQPDASLESLRQLAATLATLRRYFAYSGALEVVTPALSRASATDPNIHSLTTHCEGADPSLRYFHTSPEFPMKRLLAAGSGDIYQICKVFRAGERGRRHNPEFTLLEWYRVGIDHHQLMREVDTLIRKVWDEIGGSLPQADFVTCEDAVRSACGASLHSLDVENVRSLLLSHGFSIPDSLGDHLDDWLDLLMSEVVFPTFKTDRFTFLYDYPASQAALSRIGKSAEGHAIAERFELFFGSLELANGFHELCDSDEQRIRFKQDQQYRRQQGLPEVPMDEHLLAALSYGLPPCAGVALGIERLLMVLGRQDHINHVLSFGFDHA